MGKNTRIIVGVLTLMVSLAPPAAAEKGTPSKEEIAKEMANPNTALTSLKLQTQYFSFDGDLPAADKQDMVKLFFQPTLPFPLANGKTLWVRPGVPFVIDQPIYDADSRRLGSGSGLGDITLDVQYGTTLENGLLWSVGFSTLFLPRLRTVWGASSGLWALASSLVSLLNVPSLVSSPITSGTLPAKANRVRNSRICAARLRSA